MELFGISSAEFLVLLVVVVLVAGPKGIVQGFRLFRQGLAWLRGWSAKLREETNLSTWAAELKIDPNQFNLSRYDPRALVRQAVREEMDAWAKATAGAAQLATDTQASASTSAAPSDGAASTTLYSDTVRLDTAQLDTGQLDTEPAPAAEPPLSAATAPIEVGEKP